jgi:uncharacterized repeat protein (TIGR03803 family)
VNKDGTAFTVLHSFTDAPGEGQSPAAITFGQDGILYGMTTFGGVSNQTEYGLFGFGTVFKLGTDGSDYEVLHRFAGPPEDGFDPEGSLVEGSDGVLYGTTFDGYGDLSSIGSGTVFQINRDGSGYRTIHRFASISDGFHPSTLVLRDGIVYGVTVSGGTDFGNKGTLYKIAAKEMSFSVVHRFGTLQGDAAAPPQGLFLASDGTLYGNSSSSVFTVDRSDIYRLLQTSSGSDGAINGSLLQGADGKLYGVKRSGADYGFGGIFRLNADGSGYTNLYSSPVSDVSQDFSAATPVFIDSGVLFIASTSYALPPLSVYKFDLAAGILEVLTSFGSAGDWIGIPSGVTQAPDGALYTSMYSGGPRNAGVILKTDAQGQNSTLIHVFSGGPADGARPGGPLLFARNGALYGISQSGGTNNLGTIFKLRPDGTGFTVLHSFGAIGDGHPGSIIGFMGGPPQPPLIEDSDGSLYGLTIYGGKLQPGFDDDWFSAALFTLKKDGTGYRILHHFGSDSEVRDPLAYPLTLLLGSDGLLYGSSQDAVFRLDREGANLKVLRTPGAGALIQAKDGFLYGADETVFFRMRLDGTELTNLYSFSDLHFWPWPGETLIEGRDDLFTSPDTTHSLTPSLAFFV